MDACMSLSRELATRVRESGFSPTLVVGIREGGAFPAVAVARELGAQVEFILVQRAQSGFRHSRLGRLAARLLAAPYKRWYWVRLLAEAANRRGGHKLASIPTDGRIRGQRILVVDDFSASGRTLQRAAEALNAQGAAAIKTAVLTFLPGSERTPYPPDLSACQRWLTFSWSTDSPHYPAFQRWMREQSAATGPR